MSHVVITTLIPISHHHITMAGNQLVIITSLQPYTSPYQPLVDNTFVGLVPVGTSRSRAPLREAPASWGWLGAAASVLFSLSIVAKAGRWAVRRADTDQGGNNKTRNKISI